MTYQIRADIFPAKIQLTNPDDTITEVEKARIVVTLDHVYVFVDGQPAPSIVFEDRLTSYTPPLPSTRVRNATQLLDRSAIFETEDGYTGKFLRMGGCGCGSRLKNMSLTNLMPENTITQAASSNDQ